MWSINSTPFYFTNRKNKTLLIVSFLYLSIVPKIQLPKKSLCTLSNRLSNLSPPSTSTKTDPLSTLLHLDRIPRGPKQAPAKLKWSEHFCTSKPMINDRVRVVPVVQCRWFIGQAITQLPTHRQRIKNTPISCCALETVIVQASFPPVNMLAVFGTVTAIHPVSYPREVSTVRNITTGNRAA